MMKPGDNNLVQADFGEEEAQQVSGLLDQLETALPFLVSLSRDERLTLAKISDEHLDLVERFGHVIATRQSLFPAEHCDGAEIARDIVLARNLKRVRERLAALLRHVDSTIAAARSDAARQVSVGYGIATQLSPHVPGLASEVEPMRDHFVRTRGKRYDPEPQPPAASDDAPNG